MHISMSDTISIITAILLIINFELIEIGFLNTFRMYTPSITGANEYTSDTVSSQKCNTHEGLFLNDILSSLHE